ncbi:MAG: hypothetical protein JSW06_00210 [Thermoplasmatales archaeon]|nr:MAG: hypothetical protein JSW06_00210 [Thermoplasmatales archaeon]
MRKYLFNKTIAIGIIILFAGAGIVTSKSVKEINDHSIYSDSSEAIIESYKYKDDGNIHVYFFVDFNITVHEGVFCSRMTFDIQGRQFVPFFNAFRLSRSWSDPVVDITITKMLGQTLEFSLDDIVFILALRLNNVETDLPKFGGASRGYIEGHASFIIFF